MKFYLKILLLLGLLNRFVAAYIPLLCSNNGGICKIEDLNLFAVKFMDKASNHLYHGYIVYCKYVCSFIQFTLGMWDNMMKEKSQPVLWYQKIWQEYILPIVAYLGMTQDKEEYIEDVVCKSSAPILAVAISFVFCALAMYFRKKPRKMISRSRSKFDMSAYLQDIDDYEMGGSASTLSTLNNYDHRSCCGCKATISDGSDNSDFTS